MINFLQVKKYLGYLNSKKKILYIRNIKNKFIASKKSSDHSRTNSKIIKGNQSILICTLSGDNYIIRMFDYLFYVYLK